MAARQEHSKPKVEAFRAWAEQQLTRIPGKSDLAKAFRYGLSRWPAFCLFLEPTRQGGQAAKKPRTWPRRSFRRNPTEPSSRTPWT